MFQIDSQPFLPWPADGTLTVVSVRPNSSNEIYTLDPRTFAAYPGAIREARPSNGVFQLREYTFTFAIDAIPWPPKPRDTVEWSRVDYLNLWQSETMTVKVATPALMLRFWKLECFQLVADEDMRDSIAVWRATNTAGADGYRSSTLTQIGSAIPGRLQPEEMGSEPDTDGKLLTRTRYTAYLSSAVSLYAGDVLIVGGIKYEVLGQGAIDDFSTFTTARCTRIG